MNVSKNTVIITRFAQTYVHAHTRMTYLFSSARRQCADARESLVEIVKESPHTKKKPLTELKRAAKVGAGGI